MSKPTIYLAGPSVFHPDWAAQAAAMKAACTVRGAIGVYPMDKEVDLPARSFERGIAIFQKDRDLVRACDGVVADLSPFRGPSADVGTVWEFAYAQGLGKAVAAYSGDRSDYRLRAVQHPADGLDVESFGMADNLMLVGAHLDGNVDRRARTVGGFFGSFDDALVACLEELQRR